MEDNEKVLIDGKGEKDKKELLDSINTTGNFIYSFFSSIIMIVGVILIIMGFIQPIIDIVLIICGVSLIVLSFFLFALAKIIRIKSAIFFKLDEISKKMDK